MPNQGLPAVIDRCYSSASNACFMPASLLQLWQKSCCRIFSTATSRIFPSRIFLPGVLYTDSLPASRLSSCRKSLESSGSCAARTTMTLEWLHPGLLLIVGAWVLPLLKGNVKRAAMLVLPAAALIDCFVMRPGTYGVTNFLGQQVVFGRVDRLSLVFSYVFSIMAFIGMLYALHVKDDSQHVAALTYAGSALGVTFAGDFLSLYVFWELMAISSSLLVLLRRETSAVAAGFRYLLVHIFGGLLLLAGSVLLWSKTRSLAFGTMGCDSM